ncbi:IclR family transcriptional regulator [Pseudooceanicola sediminis]|uniref:IclR family transcriptional regulator n=1 Tax=Pseudooceanicola sediminis TaxID=2211117 RepID=A0A399J4J4_9RHOB|nr:IclR family transcriptional regulator [Pseudooceanicola sediminis]KAA2315621.1 IclR family transcriptional regulator [Puniceibacterium sp. HSS470]RII40180.1 IclR family transcriptional regulator [Pseudooceanicola sediminis]|tara:strand:- start:116193 stop:116960 length:768 start_codon:yes stop_codon:yes gene_type:complete
MGRSSESSIVTKCAQIMDVLSQSRGPMAFSEIVAQTGFVKSSCHRILAVLQGEDLVEYDKASRTYKTGTRLHNWARSAWRRIDLQQIASGVMLRLGDETGMNVALSVLDGDTILYLRTVDQMPVRYAAHPGDHAPLHCTAAGKVFLANMAQSRRDALLGALRYDRFTEFTKVTAQDVAAEFPAILRSGYGMAVQEEYLPVIGIAAPIWNAQDQVTACLNVWTMSDLATAPQVESQAQRVIAAARQISRQMGWQAG